MGGEARPGQARPGRTGGGRGGGTAGKAVDICQGKAKCRPNGEWIAVATLSLLRAQGSKEAL